MEDLKNIELDALPVCDNGYMKSKTIFFDKVYISFCSLNVPEYYKLFTDISIYYLFLYDTTFYRQVYW